MSLLFIADGKLHRFDGQKISELPNGILDKYKDKIYQNAKRNEWKTNGSGARFTEQYDPYDAEDKLKNIHSIIDSAVIVNGTLYFTQRIDQVSGIYAKNEGQDEGIVLSDTATAYADLDEKDGVFCLSAALAGESHIALVSPHSPDCRILTEGDTVDAHPTWSRFENKVIYYSSAGLALNENKPESKEEDPSLVGRIQAMNAHILPREKGPASLCRLDLNAAEIDELLSDNNKDYIKPATDPNGNLYFIRKPYESTARRGATPLGCLLDILLFPFRLLRALFGFLNFFSLAYSGKTLRKSGKGTKNRNPSEVFLEGNLIDADKELKTNAKKGDENPGIVPRSFELCRRDADGRITLLKKGVIAYCVSENGLYLSNGSAILFQDASGKEKLVCKAARVTYIFEEKDA